MAMRADGQNRCVRAKVFFLLFSILDSFRSACRAYCLFLKEFAPYSAITCTSVNGVIHFPLRLSKSAMHSVSLQKLSQLLCLRVAPECGHWRRCSSKFHYKKLELVAYLKD